MSEPTFIDRVLMLLKTLASTVAWVVGLVADIIRGKFQKS